MRRLAHDTRAARNGEPVGEMLEFGTALRHIAAGRSLTRAALTQLIREHVVAAGSVLDLGASSAASYRAILPGTPDGIMSVDVRESAFPDVVADIEREPLPFHDGSFDTVLAFNLLEHIYDSDFVLEHATRVLRPGGFLYVWVPFLIGYHPDPDDFFRYSHTSLQRKFEEAGLINIEVAAIGGRFTAGAAIALGAIPGRVIRLPIAAVALLLDRVYYRLAKSATPGASALGYLAFGNRANDGRGAEKQPTAEL